MLQGDLQGPSPITVNHDRETTLGPDKARRADAPEKSSLEDVTTQSTMLTQTAQPTTHPSSVVPDEILTSGRVSVAIKCTHTATASTLPSV